VLMGAMEAVTVLATGVTGTVVAAASVTLLTTVVTGAVVAATPLRTGLTTGTVGIIFETLGSALLNADNPEIAIILSWLYFVISA
jgi:hypothetical protein